jgi:colanic acid/amylovoran biosynthesis protein
MKRVLAMWVDPESPNYGVRALAQGLIDSSPREWKIDFVSHRLPLKAGPLSLKRLALAAVLPWHPVRKELSQYDLIIDVGEGDSFASIYGPKRFGKMVASKIAASRSGVRFVLAPQTLGPWEGRIWKCLARRAIAGAWAIWARDSGSFTRATWLNATRLELASDLAFAVQDSYDTRRGSEGVVLNVNGLLWNPNSHVDHLVYRSIITDLMDMFGRVGESVTLLAHVVAEGQVDDDVYIAQWLGAAYPNSRVVIPEDLDAIRQVIAGCRLMIGSRMHACLNALSLGVPTIPLAYSDKFGPLFGDLGYRHTVDLRHATRASAQRVVALSRSSELEGDAISAMHEGRRRIARFFEELRANA